MILRAAFGSAPGIPGGDYLSSGGFRLRQMAVRAGGARVRRGAAAGERYPAERPVLHGCRFRGCSPYHRPVAATQIDLLFLSRADVERLLDPDALLDALADAFRALSEDR